MLTELTHLQKLYVIDKDLYNRLQEIVDKILNEYRSNIRETM